MSGKLHKTPGLVLKAVKYGETSLIVTVFTELFGIQSYLVNGVRSSVAKGGFKGGLYQPAALLDLVVYHHPLKQLHRIRESKWAVLYGSVFQNVPKHAAALYMVELLTKCLKQPEGNPDLYRFVEQVFRQLDHSEGTLMANLPLYFAFHLPLHFGFRISGSYSETENCLDLQEGVFSEMIPRHPYHLEGKQAEIASRILNAPDPASIGEIPLGHVFRRQLLQQLETYYALHVPEFGTLRTLPVFRDLLQ
ncbi:MAG: repair protein RecO [Bacteroidota bacterium]|jgi:DNA repair protein RecO (recombination protein O)